MRKMLLLILPLFLLTGCACAEYWDATDGRVAVCCDDRPGCQVLQTVMMGSFADFDPDDNLNVRVLSAALPRLAAVTEDDFLHFAEYFDVEQAVLRELYYFALGNCLRADIIIMPLADDMDAQNARAVLNLFLNPAGEGTQEQMQAIRENCTEEAVLLLAENAAVPAGFVEYLMEEKPAEG